MVKLTRQKKRDTPCIPLIRKKSGQKETLWPRISFCIRYAIKIHCQLTQSFSANVVTRHPSGIAIFQSMLANRVHSLTICVTRLAIWIVEKNAFDETLIRFDRCKQHTC